MSCFSIFGRKEDSFRFVSVCFAFDLLMKRLAIGRCFKSLDANGVILQLVLLATELARTNYIFFLLLLNRAQDRIQLYS